MIDAEENKYRDLIGDLKKLPKVNAPQHFAEELLGQVTREKAGFRHSRIFQMFTRKYFLTSAAASILVVISGYFVFRHTRTTNTTEQNFASTNPIIIYLDNRGITPKRKNQISLAQSMKNGGSRINPNSSEMEQDNVTFPPGAMPKSEQTNPANEAKPTLETVREHVVQPPAAAVPVEQAKRTLQGKQTFQKENDSIQKAAKPK